MRKIKLLTVGLILSLLLSVTGLVTAATTGTWTIGTTYVPNLGAGGMTSQSNLKKTRIKLLEQGTIPELKDAIIMLMFTHPLLNRMVAM